ncbi:hypothetical protein OnM2_030054 [Erysiphe neolycopersici]|uniref:Uncharacterized protein n=1 Tax=Erysiphe neolycopersici TaxID=212602 RepID=A0A420HZE0_9PEZI|nr:hypothetical protein OnM2_030054 [Erysiphe neolycopersici]
MDMAVTNNAKGNANQDFDDQMGKFIGHHLWHAQDRIGKAAHKLGMFNHLAGNLFGKIAHEVTNKIGKAAYDIGKAAHEIRVNLGKTAEKVGKVIHIIGTTLLPFYQGIPRKILRVALITLCTAIGSFVLVFLIYFILSLLGWASVGITAGSVAALWQSTMGGFISAGGLFAFLQSVSMGAWL